MAIDSREIDNDRVPSDNTRLDLNMEARDALNAGRRLAYSEDTDDYDLAGAVKELGSLIAEQKASNERIARQMRRMVNTMMDVLDEVKEIKKDAVDETHTAQQAALSGVNKAQMEAEAITIRNINEVTAKSGVAIDKMVQEAKKRIERLAMITLPDRLFHFGKWVALILILIILCHIAWVMFVG